jgi:hypothetical protein
MAAAIADDQKDLLLCVPDETRHEVDEDRTIQGALTEWNRMRPRLLIAAIMLIENFCLVRVRTGVWSSGATPRPV